MLNQQNKNKSEDGKESDHGREEQTDLNDSNNPIKKKVSW
jgi:hypothetical protein